MMRIFFITEQLMRFDWVGFVMFQSCFVFLLVLVTYRLLLLVLYQIGIFGT